MMGRSSRPISFPLRYTSCRHGLRFEAAHDDDPAPCIRQALAKFELNVPTFSGFGQFEPPHLVPSETGRGYPFSTTDMPSAGVPAAEPTLSRSRHQSAPRLFSTKSNTLSRMNLSRRAGDTHGFPQEMQPSCRCSRPGARGPLPYPRAHRRSPSPETLPRSRNRPRTEAFGASARSCSESATCRVHRIGMVDGAIRFIRCCQSSSVSTKRSRRAVVSRETGDQRQRPLAIHRQAARLPDHAAPRLRLRPCGVEGLGVEGLGDEDVPRGASAPPA